MLPAYISHSYFRLCPRKSLDSESQQKSLVIAPTANNACGWLGAGFLCAVVKTNLCKMLAKAWCTPVIWTPSSLLTRETREGLVSGMLSRSSISSYTEEAASPYVLVTQLGPTLCDPMDCIPPASSAHDVFQARILEWVVISSSGGSSQARAQTLFSCIAVRFFTMWATSEAQPLPWRLANWFA